MLQSSVKIGALRRLMQASGYVLREFMARRKVSTG